MQSEPQTTTGWMVLAQHQSGQWLAMSYPEPHCPVVFVCETLALEIAAELLGDLVLAAIVLEVAVPVEAATSSDWNLCSEADRSASEEETRQRLARPAQTVGYLVIASAAGERHCLVVCRDGRPEVFPTAADAEEHQALLTTEGAVGAVWPVLYREKATTP